MNQKKLIVIDDYRKLTKQIRALEKKLRKLPIVAMGWRKDPTFVRGWTRPDVDRMASMAEVWPVGTRWAWRCYPDSRGFAKSCAAAKRECDAQLRRDGVLL